MRDIFTLRAEARLLDARNRAYPAEVQPAEVPAPRCLCGNLITITDVNYTCRECRTSTLGAALRLGRQED